MAFKFDIFDLDDKSRVRIIEREGFIREALAAYFLSALPYSMQTPKQREKHRRMVRFLAEIEEYSILQSANIRRPLKYGDINSLIYSTLKAASKILRDKGIALEISCVNSSFTTAAEPRIITAALVKLISAAVNANPQGILHAKVRLGSNSLIVAVKGDNPVKDKKALALARAAARLHKGGIVVSDGTTVFSIRTGLAGAIGCFSVPTVDEILKNPLSAVNVGLAFI
ncbi:MAG TPA: hypothetical protein PLG48_01860 [Candidatus Avimonas sp.]|nr:hypothetical protein [Clostridiales bacterium]HPU58243.1 hypothetical protein [Candidatus Avimonas sp.]